MEPSYATGPLEAFYVRQRAAREPAHSNHPSRQAPDNH